MAGDLQSLALEKAELLSSRLKELLTSGQSYVRAQFGVDLGLKPELYPTWVILSTAAVGLLLLLSVSWAAICGGLLTGKKRRSPIFMSYFQIFFLIFQKTQSNGQPVVVAQEEVKETVAVSITSQIKAAKVCFIFKRPETIMHVCVVQAPVQVKKNKKKAKPDVKPAQQLSSNDGKEPDEGAWETKVSSREKRQQRRKEKGSEDSGSSGGAEAPKSCVEAPVVTATAKKNRGNHGSNITRFAVSVGISEFDAMAAADPSSDWNAPAEHWGNYEEPSVLVAAASLQKDQTVPIKVPVSKTQSCTYGLNATAVCLMFLLYCHKMFPLDIRGGQGRGFLWNSYI
uniref:Metadherin a n=1 Tax=Nothobranchius furzeri TaxID=105023 RepID=A0A8C6M4C0_NOTFU